MNRRAFTFGFCSCAASALAACVADGGAPAPTTSTSTMLVPRLGPGYQPARATDEGGLWDVMQRQENEVRRSRFLVRNPDVTDYVGSMTRRLAGDHAADVRTYVLRTPYFNATMAPNGMMQVWTGLLLRVQNEAQLAAILGHELGHYLRQHSLEKWRDARDKTNFSAFLSLGLGAVGAGAAAALPQLIALASIYSYNRDQEREADAYGLELMANAGYAPIEASKVWAQLIEELKASKTDKQQSVLFASHPEPEERLGTLRKLAEQKPPGEIFRERYVERMRPIRTALLRDEIRLRNYPQTEVVLGQLIAAGGPDGELLFFKGELYRLRGEKDDAAKALSTYEEALAQSGAPPETHRSMGFIHYRAKDTSKANAAFRRYLELRPDAEDKAEILSYLGLVS